MAAFFQIYEPWVAQSMWWRYSLWYWASGWSFPRSSLLWRKLGLFHVPSILLFLYSPSFTSYEVVPVVAIPRDLRHCEGGGWICEIPRRRSAWRAFAAAVVAGRVHQVWTWGRASGRSAGGGKGHVSSWWDCLRGAWISSYSRGGWFPHFCSW